MIEAEVYNPIGRELGDELLQDCPGGAFCLRVLAAGEG